MVRFLGLYGLSGDLLLCGVSTLGVCLWDSLCLCLDGSLDGSLRLFGVLSVLVLFCLYVCLSGEYSLRDFDLYRLFSGFLSFGLICVSL